MFLSILMPFWFGKLKYKAIILKTNVSDFAIYTVLSSFHQIPIQYKKQVSKDVLSIITLK